MDPAGTDSSHHNQAAQSNSHHHPGYWWNHRSECSGCRRRLKFQAERSVSQSNPWGCHITYLSRSPCLSHCIRTRSSSCTDRFSLRDRRDRLAECVRDLEFQTLWIEPQKFFLNTSSIVTVASSMTSTLGMPLARSLPVLLLGLWGDRPGHQIGMGCSRFSILNEVLDSWAGGKRHRIEGRGWRALLVDVEKSTAWKFGGRNIDASETRAHVLRGCILALSNEGWSLLGSSSLPVSHMPLVQ